MRGIQVGPNNVLWERDTASHSPQCAQRVPTFSIPCSTVQYSTVSSQEQTMTCRIVLLRSTRKQSIPRRKLVTASKISWISLWIGNGKVLGVRRDSMWSTVNSVTRIPNDSSVCSLKEGFLLVRYHRPFRVREQGAHAHSVDPTASRVSPCIHARVQNPLRHISSDS